MSDISIPGVPGSSRFDTDKMIEALMAAERVGLDRMESRLEETRKEKGAWQTLNRNLSRVRESSRSLYGFENPFGERISILSDESILTATASREAVLESTEIIVKQLASRDRFLSRPLNDDFEVDSGKYTFAVGERKISFTFRGGDIEELADTIKNVPKALSLRE